MADLQLPNVSGEAVDAGFAAGEEDGLGAVSPEFGLALQRYFLRERVMDAYRILLDGVEVGRISGESLELGKRTERDGVTHDDLKCIKRTKNGQSLFVLMASSMKNVSVERVDEVTLPAQSPAK